MKKNKTKNSQDASQNDQMKTDDFEWLYEIHTVLSPFWSARSGYQK